MVVRPLSEMPDLVHGGLLQISGRHSAAECDAAYSAAFNAKRVPLSPLMDEGLRALQQLYDAHYFESRPVDWRRR